MAFLEFYKKGQGSIGRLLALASVAALLLWGGYTLWAQLQGSFALSRVVLAVPHVGLEITWALILSVVLVLACGFGLVWLLNRPRTVDLLIETEAEMKKVSWPSRSEAWNSSVVVVVTVVVLMGLLFFYDFVLNFVLKRIFGA